MASTDLMGTELGQRQMWGRQRPQPADQVGKCPACVKKWTFRNVVLIVYVGTAMTFDKQLTKKYSFHESIMGRR